MKIEHLVVPAVVGFRSLVGVWKENFPLSFGNYFSLAHGMSRENPLGGVRVVNFWAENLDEARERFLPDGLVTIFRWSWETKTSRAMSIATIDEPRIPDAWYNSKMCWTGCCRPPLELAREMYAVHGDPTGELEWWTDSVSYHAKRGGTYNPETGNVKYDKIIQARTL